MRKIIAENKPLRREVWVVTPDADSVAVLSDEPTSRLAVVPTCDHPRTVATTPVRPVLRRANLSAPSTASAPELHRKTRSRPGGAISASLASTCARWSL